LRCSCDASPSHLAGRQRRCRLASGLAKAGGVFSASRWVGAYLRFVDAGVVGSARQRRRTLQGSALVWRSAVGQPSEPRSKTLGRTSGGAKHLFYERVALENVCWPVLCGFRCAACLLVLASRKLRFRKCLAQRGSHGGHHLRIRKAKPRHDYLSEPSTCGNVTSATPEPTNTPHT
jgi:hypothetical protein